MPLSSQIGAKGAGINIRRRKNRMNHHAVGRFRTRWSAGRRVLLAKGLLLRSLPAADRVLGYQVFNSVAVVDQSASEWAVKRSPDNRSRPRP